MALVCEITRHASSTITRHIQAFSRITVMQHDLLCVVYSGSPCWNIRCKSNALSGKGKRKDKAHNARMRGFPARPSSCAAEPPYTFDFLLRGKSKLVTLYIDIFDKILKTNKPLIRSLLDNVQPRRTRNKLEMSQHGRRAFSADGEKSTFQCSNNRNEGSKMEKRSAKPFDDPVNKAHSSVKAETFSPKTGSTQTEFKDIVKNSAKPGHVSSGGQENGQKKLKRSNTTVGPETNYDLQNSTGNVSPNALEKDCVQEIKPTLVEIVKKPTKSSTESFVEKTELGFKSEGAVIRGTNFILLDQKLYFKPGSETRQSGCKSRETDSKNAKMSKSNTSMLDGATRGRQPGELQQQGGVIQGSNFIIFNNKSIPTSGRDGRSSEDIFTPDINSGPVITNSTDSVANGNKHTFVLADAVEHAMGKRYGKEKRNFVWDNDNPHIIAKSKDAACNKSAAKQVPRHSATSAKLECAFRESETVSKQTNNDGDKKKQIVAEKASGSNKTNSLANETTKIRSSYIEDNIPLTSFESVIKDSQKLIEQIQKDNQNMSTFNDLLQETQPIATGGKNKILKTNMTKTKTKLNEDSKVVQTEVCEHTDPNAMDASKVPKVSVKELKPELKGTKAAENDVTPGTRRKKDEGEPSLYVKPEELCKKISPQSRELGREKEMRTQPNKSCNDPSKKSKPDSVKTTSADFENWSNMLRQRIMNNQNLTSQQGIGPSAAAISKVSVTSPTGSIASTKKTASPSALSKSPPAISISAAQEMIRAKTKSKHLDDLRKNIQASFSGEFKSKFSEKPQINTQKNATSDLFTKYGDYLAKGQRTCSNTKLDEQPVVRNQKLEFKPSAATKLGSGDPTIRSGTGMSTKKKENKENNTTKLIDRYVLLADSEWAKVGQAIFSEEMPQSRAETIKTQDRATPNGDRKGKLSRAANEPSSCQTKIEQKLYKNDEMLSSKQSESLKPATQSTGSFVVDKLHSKRYVSETEACRSNSDTSLGSAAKLNKINALGCGKVAATKSASSLPVQPQMRQIISQEIKHAPGKGSADDTDKLEKVKTAVDSTPKKVKYFDKAVVENVDTQEFQNLTQLKKKIMENCEKDLIKVELDLIKVELALKKYKAFLSLVKKSTLK